MSDQPLDRVRSSIADELSGVRDALTVRRVFGDAYTIGETTVIPVARVSGGAGGGGGEGRSADDESGRGFGSGFGLDVRPIGVYEVRGDDVRWRPVVDVTRLVRGGQLLAGAVIVIAGLRQLRRRR